MATLGLNQPSAGGGYGAAADAALVSSAAMTTDIVMNFMPVLARFPQVEQRLAMVT
jgi:hypothetical protein